MNVNMSRWYNYDKGAGCFIIGNGPSLKKYNLNLISDIAPTFGTNRIYLDFLPTYFVVVNRLIIEQWHEDIKKFKHLAHTFIPVRYQKEYPDICKLGNWIKTTGDKNRGFQTNLNEEMWEGHTVTYVALQIAYWMGYQTVYLIGVDHDYGDIEGQPNQMKTMSQPDKGHYREDYFPVGSKWHLPDLENAEKAYELARDVYELDGRKIYIAQDSKLDVFDKFAPPDIFLEGDKKC